MYIYLNSENNEIAALMPSNRGRIAANHTAEDIDGVSLSVSYVTPEKLAELKTAADIKEYVTEHGSVAPKTAADKHVVLAGLLQSMVELLAYDGTTTHAKSLVTLGELRDALNEGIEAGSIANWRQMVAKAAVKHRGTVNTIMSTRHAGWRSGVAEVPNAAAMTAVVPAAAFGFSRLCGADAPKLGVVSGEEGPAEKKESAGVFYPAPDATYITSPQVDNLFRILDVSSRHAPQNVNLIGPHGCGKTELAIQFAARHKRPLLIMDCANLREARDWFGYKTAKEGTVYWHESQFVRAVQAGNHVILLDELNRANPNLLNTLMPLLDGRRFTYLEERGDKILVGPGTVFFASMNEGAGYTGTSALDRAVRDRFPRAVELTYLGESDEVKLLMARTGVTKDIATRLVQMANKIRSDAKGLSATLTESMSTRQLLAAAADFAIGGVDTLQFTVANHFSPDGEADSERLKVQSLIQGKFGDIKAAEMAAAKGA